MRLGKTAAQVAHASMSFLTRKLSPDWRQNWRTASSYKVCLSLVEEEWLSDSFTKVVVSVNSEEDLRSLIEQAEEAGIVVHEVIDSGRTEFHGVPTLTCAAFGPDDVEKLDPITGHLPLL